MAEKGPVEFSFKQVYKMQSASSNRDVARVCCRHVIILCHMLCLGRCLQLRLQSTGIVAAAAAAAAGH